jgi:hypothetical protein
MKTEEKTKELKDKSMQTMHIGPAKDAHDIQALGTTRLENLTADFENTMAEIENESDYDMGDVLLGPDRFVFCFFIWDSVLAVEAVICSGGSSSADIII